MNKLFVRINGQILIDAGHGTVQFLIRHENRLPDAIVLTHSHLDHTLALDWIIQSYHKQHRKQKKIPLYATRRCWETVATSFPQLQDITAHRELKPGMPVTLEEIKGMHLTAFPVFHGDRSPGASMLFFETVVAGGKRSRVLFTGDVLCPLMREPDYENLAGTELVFSDANNRFPYPPSKHWSISPRGPDGTDSRILTGFRRDLSPTYMITQHMQTERDRIVHEYFDRFIQDMNRSCPLSLPEFALRLQCREADALGCIARMRVPAEGEVINWPAV